MKVIVAVVLALSSVSALGSGPYLPSGWRPQGPTFYLPGEIQKPADSPLKEKILIETEASGSDALREYGPPKVEDIAQNIIQGLPDVVTEQTFFVQEAVETEVNAELKSKVQEATTEVIAEEVTEALRIADIQLQQDLSTVSYETETKEQTTEEQKEEIQATIASVEERASLVEIAAEISEVEAKEVASVEKLEKIVEVEEKAVEEVKNIAEAIVSLEKEVAAVEAVAALKTNEESSGSVQVQVPEGFLEYGPPGFREYGPPKAGDLRSAIVQESDASFENNEARRRRFSPKLRVTKSKRHH